MSSQPHAADAVELDDGVAGAEALGVVDLDDGVAVDLDAAHGQGVAVEDH